MATLVATASGRLTGSDRAELKRISEKIGDSATPKKAVLMWVAKASPRKRAYSQTPSTMLQTFSRFLPNSAKPSTRNRQATDAPVILAPAT
jgi:hypothetical protein